MTSDAVAQVAQASASVPAGIAQRVSAIEKMATTGRTRPLLAEADWAAPKTVCSG
jgi:hypothetical protein